jgi:predicted dehydrogenase
METTRRSFLQESAATLAGLTLLGTSALAAPVDRVNLALIGIRGRGKGLALSFAGMKDARVAYLCDVDSTLLPPLAKLVSEKQGSEPKTVKDFREALRDKDIHGVVIATPDHWHALATVWACQAGKHVYVEKPVSHGVWEGRKMVEAARKHNVNVQVGTQSRSVPFYLEAIEYVRGGKIGKVYMAKAWNSQLRRNIGKRPGGAAPDGVDYDLWLGPAPERPFHPARFHSSWRWFWDYGCGDMGNDGVHDLDIARWGLGATSPTSVTCTGSKVFFDDDQETPDTQYVTFEFPEKKLLVYEQRLWSPYHQEGFENGVAFYGTEGYILVGRSGWKWVGPGNKPIPTTSKPYSDEPHRRDFLDCIRSGRRPNADIEEGHRSTVLAHLGNIATRLGRRLAFDPKAETIPHDAEAAALLRRTYRKPFEVPERV